MTVAIRCVDLHKRYPGRPPMHAVCGVDLEVRRGECFGLLGPNGAGKTTSIEIIEGLRDASSGIVEVLGRSWDRDRREIKQRIGVSFQEAPLPEKLTVHETLVLFRSFYQHGPSPDDVIRRVSLEDKSNSWVKTLSGGQRQRLGVACALVGNPELLFLDEPTTGLDPQSRRQLWQIIRDFREADGTVLLTTHYMDEAERLCDRVAIIDRGRIIACDTPQNLIAQIGGEHVIEFTTEETHAAIEDPAFLSDLPGVHTARRDGERICLSVAEPHRALPQLLAALVDRNFPLASLTTRHASLEDVFVTLTGRHLSESTAESTSTSAQP